MKRYYPISLFLLGFLALPLWASCPQTPQDSVSIPAKKKCLFSDKKKLDDFVARELDIIETKATQRDVSLIIKQLKNELALCGQDPQKTLNPMVLKHYEEIGFKSEYIRQRDLILHESQFRRITSHEGNLRKYAKMNGVDSNSIEKLLKEANKKGIIEEAKEKSRCDGKVDLSEKFNPPDNLDTVGWCYAVSIARLVGDKLGQRLSPIDIAINYRPYLHEDLWNNAKRMAGVNETTIKGAYTDRAFEQGKERGFCLEKNLPFTDQKNTDYLANLSKVDNLKLFVGDEDRIKDKVICLRDFTDVKVSFPGLENVEQYIEALADSSRISFLKELADKSCHPRIKASKLDLKSVFPESIEEKIKLFSVVDELLNKNRPLSVSLNSAYFSDPGGPKPETPHSALLIGKRFNSTTGQCEYLVRNHYGRSSASYSSSLKSQTTCDGDIWLPKAQLTRIINGIRYIE